MRCKWNLIHRTILTCGIPGGSVLVSLLFIIYINDFLKCIEHATPGMFADDTYIIAAHEGYSQLNVPEIVT